MYKYLEINNNANIFFSSISNLKCTPSDRKMPPRLRTPDLTLALYCAILWLTIFVLFEYPCDIGQGVWPALIQTKQKRSTSFRQSCGETYQKQHTCNFSPFLYCRAQNSIVFVARKIVFSTTHTVALWQQIKPDSASPVILQQPEVLVIAVCEYDVTRLERERDKTRVHERLNPGAARNNLTKRTQCAMV